MVRLVRAIMPPKKREKGGKGATAAGVKASDEPPQPEQGSPFCLTLTLDVCLDYVDRQKPSTATVHAVNLSANGAGQEAGNIEGSDDQAPLLVDPVFRYTFVNGDKITTPAVGLTGSTWTRLATSNAGDAGAGTPKSDNVGVGANGAGPEIAEKGGGEAARRDEVQRCVVWRYTRTHQLQGADDDEVAVNLDRNPFMQVTLADKSAIGATVQPPGPGPGGTANAAASTDGASGEERGTSSPGRNFIASWSLDLSAFLAGETGVGIFVGQICPRVQSGGQPDADSTFSHQHQEGEVSTSKVDASGDKTTIEEDSRNDRRADAPPAPPGIRYMHLAVSVSQPELLVEGDAPEALPRRDSTTLDNASVAGGAGGSAPVTNLLARETVERLNPLSITITSAILLPGVTIDAESLQKHLQPTKFALLEEHCKPVYTVCRPFPDSSLGDSLHPRVLWTPFSAQKSEAWFGHTSAFLLGPMDRHRLEEWAENFTLSVEVHDRDPALSEKENRERILRLERMVAGGYPVEVEGANIAGDIAADASDGGANSSNEEAQSGAGQPPTVRYAEPRDIYEVDAFALRAAIDTAVTSGKDCAHGVASFRLSGLLDQSRQLVSAYNASKREHPVSSSRPSTVEDETQPTIAREAIAAAINMAPKIKLRSEICQRKRREIPKGGIEEWHLSDAERFVRWPGAYLDAGSSLGIRLGLARPLRTLQEGSAERTGPATEELRPVTRAVFIVAYEEGGQLVREINAAMDEINGRALNNVQGSLRAYRLTSEERQAVDAGSIDLVCGFMMIDEDSRTIVLEGLAGLHGGLTELLAKVGRAGPNGQAYRALKNPKVRCSGRLYSSFDADLKKVRLRDPLPILCRNPEIYDRSKVSADCFDALHSLRMLRKVNRLREATEQGLFPLASQLIQVESKYGESISIKDITGREPVKKNKGKNLFKQRRPPDGVAGETDDGQTATGRSLQESDVVGQHVGSGSLPARRKAATDSKNEAFEEWLRGRQPRNFLGEQEEVSGNMYEEYMERRRRRQEVLKQETVRTDWCYGPQTLNYVELKKAEMRERLSKDKAATFTYSADYVSQTVSMVDEFRVKEDQEAQSRSAWKTKRGFVWPCPRTRQELITHSHKPSESRIDVLREPWVENELTGGRGDEDDPANEGPPQELAWRRNFDTVPSNGMTIFGGLKLPRYRRELDTSLIGSRLRLPRGRQHLEKDPEFFRSVHLVGEGLAKEKEEAKRKAEKLWRSKVVVDDTNFRAGNFSVRDVPVRVDRAKDILELPVKKTAFKIVRNTKLPSGRRAPLRPAPVSAFSSEPFTEPEDFTVSIRANHPDLWAGADSLTGEKLDFYLRLHSDRMKPESQKICARSKHPPMLQSEMRGPRWETGRRCGRDGA